MEASCYFESYEDLKVHKLMLEDGPRNRAFRNAILSNADAFEDKIVLDVGAGTGILSVYCAMAGAKKVYAVEASNVYKITEETAEENGYQNIIKVINSTVEAAELPEKVDIIVSEWMGMYLLHEAMLSSVIVARDKFLKPSGLIFPNVAKLYAQPCSVPSMYDFWENVDGISMRYFAEKMREHSEKVITEQLGPESMTCYPEIVILLDLQKVTLEEISSISVRHVATAKTNGKIEGICLWFSCSFPGEDTDTIELSTSPEAEPTHWKQTIIYFPFSTSVEQGTPIAYDLTLQRSSEDCRKYIIDIEMLDASEIEHPNDCRCLSTKCVLVREMLEKYLKEKGEVED